MTHQKTLRELSNALHNKEISSVELTSAVLDKIHLLDPKINAYLTVIGENALKQASLADARLNSNENIQNKNPTITKK